MLMLVNLVRMTQGKAWGKNREVNRRISSMDQETNDRIFNFDSRQRNGNWNGKKESSWDKSESLKPLLTLWRLSMAKSKVSLAKCHIAPETTWGIFKHLLILISNMIPQWEESTLCMISIPLDHEIFAPCFMSLDMSQCLLAYGLWKLA